MFTVRFPSRSRLALAAALALGPAASRAVRAADGPTTPESRPSQQELINRIDSLGREVEQLKSQLNETRRDDQRRDAKETADAVQHDADRYGPFQLMENEGFTAGYSDNKFLIQSADRRYVLHPWIQIQVRNETTYRSDALNNGKDSDTQNGFEIRRLKFGLDGNVINPDLSYWVQFNVDRKSGNLQLEQAWGKYRIPNTPFFVKAGQFKEPLDHEQLLASRYLTALERTLTDDLFFNGEGFLQGVSGGFDNGGAVRAEVAFTDGQRSANTNFQDFPTNSTDYGAAGRVEYKLFGKWKDYDRTTGAYDATDNFLVVGAGADYTEAGDSNTLTHVVDADFGTKSGFALYGAYAGRAFHQTPIGSLGGNIGTTGTTKGADGYDYSFRGQVSYAIDAHWEPYAQYEYVKLDGRSVPSGSKDLIHVFRVGVNYYLFNTQARVSLDASYLPNGSPISDDGIGLLGTGATSKTSGFSHGGGDEFIVRAQFQLAL